MFLWDMCDLVERWKQIDPKVKIKGAFLMWSVWGDRNNMIFNGKATPHQVLLNRVDQLAEDYGKYSKQIYSRQSAPAHSSPKV